MLAALVLLTLLAVRLHPSGASLTSRSSTVSSRTHSTFWIVGAGQTLAVISARTGLPASAINDLNPGADAGGLMIGEKLRLRASRVHAG